MEEQAHFAQSTEIDLRGKHIRKDVVNNVRNVRRDIRKCYSCGKPRHIMSACPGNKDARESSDDVEFVLSVDDSSAHNGYWILDSGSSRHLKTI